MAFMNKLAAPKRWPEEQGHVERAYFWQQKLCHLHT